MNIGRKASLMLFANGVQQTSTIILLGVFSRILVKSEYATFSQGDLIVKTLLPLLLIGIPISVSYYIPKSKDINEEKLISFNSFVLLFLTASIGAFILLLFKDLIAQSYQNIELSSAIPFISLYLFFEVIVSITPNYLLSTNQNKKLAIYTVIISLLKIAILLVVYFLFKSVTFLFISLLLVSILKFIFLFFQLYQRYKHVSISFDFSVLKTQFVYAIIIGASQIVGKISGLLDKNIISVLFTPQDYAVFVNGTIEVPFIGLIGGSIATVLLPEFSKVMDSSSSSKNDLVILEQWKKSINITSIIMIPIMFTLLLYAEGFMELIFSSKYLESTTLFRIYLLKIPVGIATYSTLLLAKGKNKCILYNSLIALIVNFVLNLVLIKLYGMSGAAASTVISFYLLAGLQIYQISMSIKVRFVEVLPFKNINIVVVLGLVTSVVFAVTSNLFMLNNVLELLLFGPIYYFLNIFLLYKFGLFDVNVIRYLIGRK